MPHDGPVTYAIVEAPSVLGFFPRGVEQLPEHSSTPASPRRSVRAGQAACPRRRTTPGATR